METSTAAPAPPGRIVRPRNQGLFGLPPMLRYAADRRMVGMILTFFALETWQWVAPPQSWWVKVPVFLATCAVSFLGAVATHNTLHCPVFHAGWMNSLWQVALTLTYGHPVCSFVPGHNLSHHRHTETRRDIMRTSKARFRWNLLNLLFFASSISSTILGAEIGYLRATWRRRPRWGRQLLLETSVWLGLLAVLFVVEWRKALVYVMIPHAYAAWGIVTMNLLQHDGCDPESKVNHSRNFVGAALNWWTFNNGYHTIHHMRPGRASASTGRRWCCRTRAPTSRGSTFPPRAAGRRRQLDGRASGTLTTCKRGGGALTTAAICLSLRLPKGAWSGFVRECLRDGSHAIVDA